MAHQDARCATDAETTVVTAGGTMPTVFSLTGKRLVVVRGTVSGSTAWTLSGPQMSIIGQGGSLGGPGASGPTLHVTGGDLYMRGLSVTNGSPGIQADGGGVLRLERVSVSSNTAGGVLIDGSGFDIKNTSITSNGTVNSLEATWAGLRIQNLTSSASGPKTFSYSSVTSNQNTGVSCAAGTAALLTPTPISVFATGNIGGVDVSLACGFTSCSAASTTCGAQP